VVEGRRAPQIVERLSQFLVSTLEQLEHGQIPLVGALAGLGGCPGDLGQRRFAESLQGKRMKLAELLLVRFADVTRH
jgi:hypothetical protein